MRKMFRIKAEEVTGEWRELFNEELQLPDKILSGL
jgi:hypothetical protein